jgi:sugar phosphate isomerase/epimerase
MVMAALATTAAVAAEPQPRSASAPAPASPPTPEPPWTPLFDGKTLKGWMTRGGAAKYEVKDGAIVGTTVPNTKNTFLCTERSYGDFVLELEFKVDPELNSGVQIRGQSRPDYQDGRVHGYQVEIDPDVTRGRLWTGGLYDEGRRGWLHDLKDDEAARKAFRPGAWNRMRVDARGDVIKVWINDVLTTDHVDATDLEGFIGLQVHQVGKREQPFTVAWRGLRIKDFGRRSWRPLLDGKTLKGWKPAGGGQFAIAPGAPAQDGKPAGPGTLVGTLPAGERRHGLLFLESSLDSSPDSSLAPSPEPSLAGRAVRAEVKLTGGNGGLYVAARPAETPAGATGLQVDLDAKGGGLYETGGRGWLVRAGELPDKVAKAWKPGDWNRVTVSWRDGTAYVALNDLRAGSARLEPAGGPAQLALELSPGAAATRLEVRRMEVMSDPVPPPVAGYPIGWCIRVNGSAPDDARAAGFEYLELALQDVVGLTDEEFARAAERLAATGLPALTGYNFIPAELPLIGDAADPARQQELFDRGLPRLAKLGLEYVVFNSGPARKAPEGLAPEKARRQLVEFSRRFAREARKHGLTVLLQPLRSTDTNMVTTVPEALQVIRAVGAPNFQLLVDNSFMAIQKEDPSVLLRARPHLRHVWLAKPDGRTYPVGADRADYQALFAALAKIGYRGGLSVHAKTDNFFADAPRALRFLREQAAALAAPGRPRRPPGPPAASVN